MPPKRLWHLLVLLILVFPPPALMADDDKIISTINEATLQYTAGKYSEAASNLDYAAQLVRQRKSEKLKSFLPKAPTGWIANEIRAQTLGAAMLGGGITVSRDYRRGASLVSLEIVADSPVLQSVLAMMKNPVLSGVSGTRMETIQGQKALIKYNSSRKKGELYVVVDSRFLVSIKGKDLPQEDLFLFGEKIQYNELAKQ